MDQKLKSNLTSSHHWFRLVYMLLFAFALQLASLVMWGVVVIQFLFALITGNDNEALRKFGCSLSQFIYQALKFLTYNTEEKPFPFADWPEEGGLTSERQVFRAEEVVSTPDSSESSEANKLPKE